MYRVDKMLVNVRDAELAEISAESAETSATRRRFAALLGTAAPGRTTTRHSFQSFVQEGRAGIPGLLRRPAASRVIFDGIPRSSCPSCLRGFVMRCRPLRTGSFRTSAISAANVLFFVLLLASPATAHDLARSESRCTIQGASTECELIVDLLQFPGVDADGNGTISYAELDRSIADVFARIKEHFLLRSPAEPSTVVMTRQELLDEHTAKLAVAYTFPENLSRLDVTSTFDQLSRRPDHQHYVVTAMGGVEQRAILDAVHPTVTFEFGRWTRTSIWLTVAALAIVGLRVGWFLRSRRIRASAGGST
jgi:hypothetical protein